MSANSIESIDVIIVSSARFDAAYADKSGAFGELSYKLGLRFEFTNQSSDTGNKTIAFSGT